MKGRIDNKMGSIQIDPEVIAMYAGTTAVECFGIVGMAAVSMKDGLVRLLKKESLTHGINVAIKDNALSIDFHVIVAYGVSISTVADNLIESVKYKVEEFTGMKVEKISIYVEGPDAPRVSGKRAFTGSHRAGHARPLPQHYSIQKHRR